MKRGLSARNTFWTIKKSHLSIELIMPSRSELLAPFSLVPDSSGIWTIQKELAVLFLDLRVVIPYGARPGGSVYRVNSVECEGG
jgi:hypothetical protein